MTDHIIVFLIAVTVGLTAGLAMGHSGTNIPVDRIAECKELCTTNGGLEKIAITYFSRHSCVCHNGAVFASRRK